MIFNVKCAEEVFNRQFAIFFFQDVQKEGVGALKL